MKRTLLFFTTLALCAVSCGTVGTYADSDRFQDGIYYKPDPTDVSRTPLSEDDFRYLASLDQFSRNSDSLSVERDTVYVALADPYDWTYYGYWRPYRWNYYSHWGGYYSYWNSPYYWGYDPFYWDYGWYGYPYYYGWYGYPHYYGWGSPYHHRPHGDYAWRGSGTRMHRTGSATSGQYSRPGSHRGTGTVRTASAMAKRDIDRIKVQRNGPKSTAVNREFGYSETSHYHSATATRSGSSASYNSSSSSRYESSSSSRSTTSSSSRSSGYSGGGSHSSSSSHTSHSSGGGGYHGGGHR